jgi:hypothetical protein
LLVRNEERQRLKWIFENYFRRYLYNAFYDELVVIRLSSTPDDFYCEFSTMSFPNRS